VSVGGLGTEDRGQRAEDGGRRTESGWGGLGGVAGSRPYRARRWRVNLARKQDELGVGMRFTEARVREASAGFGRRATIRSRASADDSADRGREPPAARWIPMAPPAPGHRGRATWRAPPQ